MDAAQLDRLKEALGVEPVLVHGMPVIVVACSRVPETARTLRDKLGFDMLLDVTAVDWLGRPGRASRFEVVWHFFRSGAPARLRMKADVPEDAPVVASLTSLYGSAHFMERECHEMFGIRFDGNADLRPILLYEGFEGHPLRKDYDKHHEQPLVAYRDGAPGA